MNATTSKAWIVATSVGAVEALKDQLNICRWNYALKSVNQHAKNHIRSFSQAKVPSSAVVSSKLREDKAKQSEESLRKVYVLELLGSQLKTSMPSSITRY